MTKKLLVVCPAFLNQSETFIYALLQKITGFDKRVVCYDKRNLDVFDFDSKKVFAIRDLNFWGNLKTELGLIFNFANPLFNFLADYEPDVIHAHFLISSRLAFAIKKFFKNRPQFVLHVHGQDFFIPALKHKTKYIHERLKLADVILTPSQYVRESICKLFPEFSEKIHCYYTAIDAEYNYREPQSLAKTVNIMMLGRMVYKKGYEIGIRAFAEVVNKDNTHDYQLNIIGEGPLKEQLKQIAVDVGVADKVHFLSIKENAKVREMYYQSQIFLAPSVTAPNGDKEGLPRTVTEALALGTPVIGALHSGIPEAVIDQKTGLLFAEGDYQECAEKILWAVKNWPEMIKYSKAGRVHFDTLFGSNRKITLSQKFEGVLKEFMFLLEK